MKVVDWLIRRGQDSDYGEVINKFVEKLVTSDFAAHIEKLYNEAKQATFPSRFVSDLYFRK